VSENSITRQQAGLVRRGKTSHRNPADLAGTCSGGRFVLSKAGEAYDGRARGPNRKFRNKSPMTRCPKGPISTPLPRNPLKIKVASGILSPVANAKKETLV
jgi:hypothetical protein